MPFRPYPSSQKGGTLIAEQVTDRDEHRRRLCTPDGYRSAECPRCHHPVLHAHDRLERVLLADSIEAKGPSWGIDPGGRAGHFLATRSGLSVPPSGASGTRR